MGGYGLEGVVVDKGDAWVEGGAEEELGFFYGERFY